MLIVYKYSYIDSIYISIPILSCVCVEEKWRDVSLIHVVLGFGTCTCTKSIIKKRKTSTKAQFIDKSYSSSKYSRKNKIGELIIKFFTYMKSSRKGMCAKVTVLF